ncbi:transcriptional elongation/antitermination factor NusG-like protein [Arenibacter sp. TNZ]|jgi:transcription antitermination factor NusG|uniref:UpxY family transcription antiterminator n=1 Tax=Arenibacter TaxID=178469 RepID=UPI000CD47B54|nr:MULTISPECIES: UpxY family transcription antiterminator [Arenibacter]MCM4174105.1 transcriptional elongation/antitermination factor NusG-like protein [Arenibacter sp. TNZ]
MPWYVLHTKPKNEKKVATRLASIGVTAFCPVRTEIKQWSDRKKKVEIPLLPSLILVQISDKERATVFQVSGAVRYMFWLGKPAVVTPFEVEVLQEMQAHKNIHSMQLEAIKPGTKLDLSAMGFKSQKGTVKYISENQYWVVLEGLGYVLKIDR